MKKINFFFLIFACFLSVNLSAKDGNSPLTADFVMGNPEITSINAISFGPEGILFIGDSKNAMIAAIETNDNVAAEAPEKLGMARVDEQIATLLGLSLIHI